MTVTAPNDANSAITTMALTLELQVKRLETERPKTDKVYDEAFQQMQETINSQQACIAQLKAENLTLRHQSDTKIGNLRAALKETLAQLPKVCREKRFDELTAEERIELNKHYQQYQKGNPSSSQTISSVAVFYSPEGRLPRDDDEPDLFGLSSPPYFYVEEPHPLCVKHGPLVEKK